jgi:hypothetical protein
VAVSDWNRHLLGAEINAEIEHAAAARGVKEAKPTGEKESAA